MFKNVDHIAIKVSRLDEMRETFEDMGIPCEAATDFPEVGMRIAFVGGGETSLELLQVTDDSSPIKEDNPGPHHIGIRVKDIEATYLKMSESDRYEVIGPVRQGAHARIFFFRIKDQDTTLFECVE